MLKAQHSSTEAWSEHVGAQGQNTPLNLTSFCNNVQLYWEVEGVANINISELCSAALKVVVLEKKTSDKTRCYRSCSNCSDMNETVNVETVTQYEIIIWLKYLLF